MHLAAFSLMNRTYSGICRAAERLCLHRTSSTLYGKASSQLGEFHGRLEVLKRYLLANNICEQQQSLMPGVPPLRTGGALSRRFDRDVGRLRVQICRSKTNRKGEGG